MKPPLTIGSLCTGYGGLEMGLALAGRELKLAFVADNDPAAAGLLGLRHPGVPNLGDISLVDWMVVENVDVLTAGFPCTDVSLAGRQAGIAPGTRSGVWLEVARAIDVLRPALVLIENVRGLLSARAHSNVEPCPWCLGDRDGDDQEPVLRALGAVLGDLSSLGYDAEWVTVAASDIGACHQRQRIFVIAHPANTEGIRHWIPRPAGRRGLRAPAVAGGAVAGGSLFPTPRTSDTNGTGIHGTGGIDLRTAVSLLPTPKARDGKGRDPNPRGIDLNEAIALLPTPRATGGTKGGPNQRGSSGDLMLPSAVQAQRWADYAPAVTRWEAILGRPAPEPTEPGRDGKPRLAARFTEWLMGLPDGWVCDVPDLTRNEQLRLLGNGVVPQQCAHALDLLSRAAIPPAYTRLIGEQLMAALTTNLTLMEGR